MSELQQEDHYSPWSPSARKRSDTDVTTGSVGKKRHPHFVALLSTKNTLGSSYDGEITNIE